MAVPSRTNPLAVVGVLGGESQESNWDGVTDVTPYIDTASAIVDRMVTLAFARIPPYVHSASELELIERWLAAHFYCMMDPLYRSKSAKGAGVSFQRASGDGNSFESYEYSRVATNLDISGCLSAIGKRSFASAIWLGGCRNPSDRHSI